MIWMICWRTCCSMLTNRMRMSSFSSSGLKDMSGKAVKNIRNRKLGGLVNRFASGMSDLVEAYMEWGGLVYDMANGDIANRQR